jgi:hypothetical protein
VPSIDHKVRVREILPGETHEFIGHLFDAQARPVDRDPAQPSARAIAAPVP